MLIDYHVHPMAHGEHLFTLEWIVQYLRRAREMGIQQIGFSDHDEYVGVIDYHLLQAAQAEGFQDIDVRVGVEVDYKPSRESEIRSILQIHPYDYVIGSVHHIGDWPFDHPDYRDEFEAGDIDGIYQAYYELVLRMVNSRLFDVVGHIDLVKIWGHRPVQSKPADYLKPLLAELRSSGMVVEINSAGLRKPVGELYPGQELVQSLFDAGIPITIGSDAHHPQDLGKGLDRAVESARKAGYASAAVFSGRRMSLISI